MKTQKYKGHQITKTTSYTPVYREAFGRTFQSVENLFDIEGVHSKNAGKTPFITSFAEAKRWINEQIEGEDDDQ